MKYLNHIIGQEKAKSIIGFELDAYRQTNFIPPILLTAKRGAGKTEIARGMKPYLTDADGKPKPFVEINGSSLKKVGGLVNKAIIPYQDAEVTYFIDEIHSIDKSVQEFLLSIINPSHDRRSTAFFDGMELNFDFHKQTFIFATTDPQKLFPAFKSRCKRIDLDPYSDRDITKIVEKYSDLNKIKLLDNVGFSIASVCRNTPREVTKMLDDIRQYCDSKQIYIFGIEDWENVTSILNIRPLGLNNTEWNVLSLLKERGEMTLTAIANSLSLNRSTIMNDVEPFLMEKNLIKVDGKRFITKFGIETLSNEH